MTEITNQPFDEATIRSFPEIDDFCGLREVNSSTTLRLVSNNSSLYPHNLKDASSFLNCLIKVMSNTFVNRVNVYSESTYYSLGFFFSTRQPITPATGVPLEINDVIADRYQFQVTPSGLLAFYLGTASGWYRVDPARWPHLEMTIQAMNEPQKFALVFTPTSDGRATQPRLHWLS